MPNPLKSWFSLLKRLFNTVLEILMTVPSMRTFSSAVFHAELRYFNLIFTDAG